MLPEPMYYEDFVVGQKFGTGSVTVGPEMIRAFAAEFDPQPFHLDEEAARGTIFRSLAASGWHTAALTMRLLVESVPLAEGLIGAETEVIWPKAVRPGMALQVFSQIVDIKPSWSKPDMAIATLRAETRDQRGAIVQILTAKMPVYKRQRESALRAA